jgi:hypothetical protein
MTITALGDGRPLLPTAPDTVAILAFPDEATPQPSTAPGDGVLQKLARIGRYRRNPRSPAYMRQVVASMLPHARVIEVNSDGTLGPLGDARHIVLLWPDAIGYGWWGIERAISRQKAPGASVYALTGRRRAFRLTPGALFGLRLRRLIERLWIGEALMAVALLVSAPFLVVWDFARGHR